MSCYSSKVTYRKIQIEKIIEKYPNRLLNIHKRYVSLQGKHKIVRLYYNGVVYSGDKKFKFNERKIDELM
jgi:hypothetical protein